MSCCQNSYNGIPCCCPETIQITTTTTCPFGICCEPSCENGNICPQIYYTDCVKYDGPSIECYNVNINPGDSYTKILQYIVNSLNYICDTTTTSSTSTTSTTTSQSVFKYTVDALFLSCNGQDIDPSFLNQAFSISSTIPLINDPTPGNVFVVYDYPTPGFNGCWEMYYFDDYDAINFPNTYVAEQVADCDACTNITTTTTQP